MSGVKVEGAEIAKYAEDEEGTGDEAKSIT